MKSKILKLMPVIVFFLYCLFYFVSVPKFVFLRSDDFGYVDSIVLSIKHNKILTSQFLEPANLTSTTISVILYHLTNSMYLAVWIPVIVSSILLFIILYKLLKTFYSLNQSLVLSLTIMTLPTVLNITLDATGIAISWFLFIAAIYFWEKKNLWLFYIVCFLAVLNRQSNIILFIFPLYELVLKRHTKKSLFSLISILITIGSLIFILGNQKSTLAQKQSLLNPVILHTTPQNNFGIFALVFGGTSFLLASCFFLFFFSPHLLFLSFKKNLSRFYLPLSIFILLFLTSCLSVPLHFQTPILDMSNLSVPVVLIFMFISLWFFPWHLLQVNMYSIAASAFILVYAFRGIWFDYYLFELFILSFLYVKEILSVHHSTKKYQVLTMGVSLCLLILHSFFYLNFKSYIDMEGLKVKVYEKALRKSQININALRDAPFGYLAWKLFHFSQKDDEKSITGFLCYLSLNGGANISVHSPSDHERQYPHLIESGKYVLGFQKVEYDFWLGDGKQSISRCKGDEAFLPSKTADYQNKVFPLNDREWNMYLLL